MTSTVPGFLIRPVHNGLCLGVINSMQEWEPVRQSRCSAGEEGQVFTLRPR